MLLAGDTVGWIVTAVSMWGCAHALLYVCAVRQSGS